MKSFRINALHDSCWRHILDNGKDPRHDWMMSQTAPGHFSGRKTMGFCQPPGQTVGIPEVSDNGIGVCVHSRKRDDEPDDKKHVFT